MVQDRDPRQVELGRQRRLAEKRREELPPIEPIEAPIAEVPPAPTLERQLELVFPERFVFQPFVTSIGLTEEENTQAVVGNLLRELDETPEVFLENLTSAGRTVDSEILLSMIGAKAEDIDEIFQLEAEQVIEPPPEPIDVVIVELDGVKQRVIRTEDNSLYDKNGNWVGYYNWADDTVFNPYKIKGKALASFVAGVGDILGISGGVARRYGYDDIGSKLSTMGKQLQLSGVPSSSAEFEFTDLLNPEFYATKIVRTIPFALSLAPLAIGGYYGGAALAATWGLGTIWTAVVGGLSSAALSRPIESALEAGSQYDDAIARGKTHEEASKEFDEVFRNNLTLAGADAFEIAIALAPTPKWVPTSLVRSGLVRTVRIGGKIIIVGLTEGGEEVYQDLIQRHARGEEFQFDPISKEVFAIGFVMGAGMGLGGDVISGVVNRSKEKMSASMRKEFDNLVNGFKDNGFNQQESELRALEETVQTLEGQKIVSDSIEEAKEVEEVIPEVAPEVTVVHKGTEPEGIEIADELGVRFEGIQEGAGLMFTDVRETGSTFTALTLEEARTKLADMRTKFAEAEAPPPKIEVPPIEVEQVSTIDEGDTAPSEEIVIIKEGGIPIDPDEQISSFVVENTPFVRDIGAKERVRPSRKVFEKMGLYKLFRGIQKAEVLIGEDKAARAKERNKIIKSVGKNKDRWSLIFREVNEAGSQVGLLFEEKQAVTFIRKWADDWAGKKNLSPDKRIKDYIPHLFEQEMKTQFDTTGKIPPEIAAMLDEKARSKITDPFLKKRLGAVGFIEDPFKAMEAYDAVSLRVLYYEPFLQKIAGIANDKNTPPVFRRYLADYSRRMTGEMSKLDKELNNTIQEFADKVRGLPGGTAFADLLSKGNVSGWVSYQMTGLLYTLWLGFKATSAIRNLSQHTLIIGETGLKHFSNGIRLRFTAEGQAVLKESLVLSSRKTAFVPGVDDSFSARWLDKFREIALAAFRFADKQNVSDAFLAGYSEAKSLLPNADRQVWIDRGDEVAADTQYLYTRMNSMSISQSAPGRVFSVLTTWSENWLELMTKWVSQRPSRVYLEYEKATGVKVTKPPWSQTFKSLAMYMLIVALGKWIEDETRFKAWEYTGVTSLRYLAGVAGGEFPGLTISGAVADFITGFVTDDDRMFKSGWNQVRRAFTPGIINQLNAVAEGDKDWLTLLFYLEGLDYEVRKLKDDWKKEFKPYEDLSDPLIRADKFPTLSQSQAQKRWREENPLIEAKMFVVGQFTTLSSEKARGEVLRLIEEHKIDTEVIKGYAKLFETDTVPELNKFQKRIGSLEKLVIGEEAEYFDMGRFAGEVHKLVNTQGSLKVMADGHPLAVELLIAENLWAPYFDYTEEGARKLYRQLNPDVEAQLYLWGKIQSFENPDSAKELLRLMDKYNIPPQAINAFQQDPSKYDELFTQKFELEQKNFELDTLYENYGNPESDVFISKDETIIVDSEEVNKRKWTRAKLKDDNPDWVANDRRIEAIDNDVPDKLDGMNGIDAWAERGANADKFNANSAEDKVWWLDHPEAHTWAQATWEGKFDPTDWNEPVLRIDKEFRTEDGIYDAIDPDAVNPNTGVSLRLENLLANEKYRKARRSREAWNWDNATKDIVTAHIEYGEKFLNTNTENSSSAMLWRSKNIGYDTFRTNIPEGKTGHLEPLELDKLPIWVIDDAFINEDAEYQAILDKFEDIEKQTEATDKFLLEHSEYHKKRFERDALKINFSRVDEYVEWHTSPIVKRPEDLADDIPFYEDDWYLMEHGGFYREMLEAKIFTKRRDFRLVPMKNGTPDRVVGAKYIEYLNIRNNQSLRDRYRLDNPDLDKWGVSVGIWVRTMDEQRRREGQTRGERIGEAVAEAEAERKRLLEELERKRG